MYTVYTLHMVSTVLTMVRHVDVQQEGVSMRVFVVCVSINLRLCLCIVFVFVYRVCALVAHRQQRVTLSRLGPLVGLPRRLGRLLSGGAGGGGRLSGFSADRTAPPNTDRSATLKSPAAGRHSSTGSSAAHAPAPAPARANPARSAAARRPPAGVGLKRRDGWEWPANDN